jgi:SAM-dependent methyltransferase
MEVAMTVDFGLTAQDYARHRAGFPPSLYSRLAAWQIGRAGQVVVDLGTGTGTLGRGFAAAGCRVIGIDPARPLLVQAHQIDTKTSQTDGRSLATVYAGGVAEAVPLRAHGADVVTAGQCWHWFNRPAAAREAARLLRPDGYLVIAHFDWIPLPGNVVEATERLIEAHNPAWKMGGGNGVHAQWLTDLGTAGYREIESFSYDTFAPYTPAGWRGRIRASAGIGASLPPAEVEAFDRALAELLAQRFPGDELAVHHRVFAVIARPPDAI